MLDNKKCISTFEKKSVLLENALAVFRVLSDKTSQFKIEGVYYEKVNRNVSYFDYGLRACRFYGVLGQKQFSAGFAQA